MRGKKLQLSLSDDDDDEKESKEEWKENGAKLMINECDFKINEWKEKYWNNTCA